MTSKKWIVTGTLVLVLVGACFSFQGSPVQAGAQQQMTAAVDPMSSPTIPAPTTYPGAAPMNQAMGAGQMDCPMMGSSMTGTGTSGQMAMPGMTGMSSMSQMGSMPMNGMSQMGSMPMNDMSQMGSMPMNGSMTINDGLTTQAGANWFLTLNPWWLLGWVVLFGLLISGLVIGILLLVRVVGKSKPNQAA